MLARWFAHCTRMDSQLVLEAIEVDVLSALHQTLDIRPAEIEVPDLRILELIVPEADVWQTLIIQRSFNMGCHKRLLSHCFARKRRVLGGVRR